MQADSVLLRCRVYCLSPPSGLQDLLRSFKGGGNICVRVYVADGITLV